jgi:formyl-CoA transferase
MLESSVSWLAVPLSLFSSFGRETIRRGNTHEFFCPVSVYKTLDGYVYLAVGNDRQWKSMVALGPFASLDKKEYEKNAGRINDVENLNRAIESATGQLTSQQMLELFRSISVPLSRIATVAEIAADPLVERRLLLSRDPRTGITLTLAPPPALTPVLEDQNRELSFPPRFGEHNREIYGKTLGHSEDSIKQLEQTGVI